MKINIIRKDSFFDLGCDDFEEKYCVEEGIQGIHKQKFPTREAFYREKIQNSNSEEVINELDYINGKLYVSIKDELYQRIIFNNKMVNAFLFLYLRTHNNFSLKLTTSTIYESVKYFEKVYKEYDISFIEIPDFYLAYVKMLSYIGEKGNIDENFEKIKKYCVSVFFDKYKNSLCLSHDDLNNAINYGENFPSSQMLEKIVAALNVDALDLFDK